MLIEPTQLNSNSITLHAQHRRLLLPLEEAVCASIEKIGAYLYNFNGGLIPLIAVLARRDVVKKLYSNIVIAGGGSMIPGTVQSISLPPLLPLFLFGLQIHFFLRPHARTGGSRVQSRYESVAGR